MIAGLLALAAGVGAYAWSINRHEQRVVEQRPFDERLISPFRLDEQYPDGGYPHARYTRLELSVDGGTTRLELDVDGWWLRAPVVQPASKVMVDSIVMELEETDVVALVDAQPDAVALAKYGLAPPRLVLNGTAELRGETRTVKLQAGVTNEFDGSLFVRRNDDPAVYAAPGAVAAALFHSADELRERRVFQVREVDIARVAARTPRGELELERHGVFAWDLVKPSPAPADHELVTAMLTAFLGEKAKGFPDDTPEARRALGFDAPLIDATLTMADEMRVRLRVTRVEGDGGTTWYGLREDPEQTVLAEFPGADLLTLDVDPQTLLDRKPLRFDAREVMKLVLRDGHGGEVVLERESEHLDDWRVIKPIGGKANGQKLVQALGALAALRASSAGEPTKDWAARGLDARARSITLYGEGDRVLSALTVGAPVPGTSRFYVRGRTERLMECEGRDLDRLPFSL